MTTSQKRAILNYRTRLSERGLARFEVLGRSDDRELIRAIARCLAENSNEAAQLRAAAVQSASEQHAKGGILAALRRSPLVSEKLVLIRSRSKGRPVHI